MQVALNCILLLLYAWNLCPVPGTNISCSLVAVSHEFAFPINYSVEKHWQLTSSQATAESYSNKLATRLSTCRKISELLVSMQREWYRALVNSCCPNPCVYLPGNIIFACHATRLDAAQGCVGKLKYKVTGPWCIIKSLKGASNAIEHCLKPSRKEKKHALDLTPYLFELIPFKPVDGTDNRYG